MMYNTRRIYEEVWAQDEYRQVNHGLNLWKERRDLFPDEFKTVLDIGCGTGELVHVMRSQGYAAFGIDIAANSVSDERKKIIGEYLAVDDLRNSVAGAEKLGVNKFDLGVCCDVMEHIDEKDVLAVLTNIWSACNEVIFVIANHKSEFLGYDLHPTKKAPEWWWRHMMTVDPYSKAEVKDLSRPGREGVFVITWKRS